MKLADVKSNPYINSSKEINDESSKFKIGNIAKILKYINTLQRLCSKLA